MKNKVLIIISSLEGGGAEKVLITILKRMNYTRFDIHLCLLKKSGIYIDEVPKYVKIINLYDKPNSFSSRLEARLYRHFRISMFDCLRIRRKVDYNYDSIISFLEGKPLRMHSYVSYRSTNNISWIHTDLVNNHNTIGSVLSRKDEFLSYRRMDKLVFVSYGAMNHFKEVYKVNVPHVVLYNPIDKDDIVIKSKKTDINKRKFTICSVGSITEVKRFDRVIRLAQRLVSNGYDIDFWIIGSGPLINDLCQLVDDFKLENYVHFLGFMNPPYPIMGMADILLITSKAEGFPLVLCEALCLGIPVIATKCTGSMEILDNDKYGILTDHCDDDIYFKVKSMIDDNDKLDHYRRVSRMRSEMFDIEYSMAKFYEIIDIYD